MARLVLVAVGGFITACCTVLQCVCADVRRRLAAQQLALEVLTNMTCSDGEGCVP